MPSYPVKGGFTKLDREDVTLLTITHWTVHRGYIQGTIDGRRVYLHNLVLGKLEKGMVSDHKNLDGLDNRRSNLRPATKRQNGMNRTRRKDNTSGYKGVYLCKTTGHWRAEIAADKKRRKLGRFSSPVKAALAYDRAAIVLHGEFARTNFPRAHYF